MVVRERAVDIGARRGRRLIAELGKELHEARVAAGLSQRVVGEAVGISTSQVSRIERGLLLRVSVYELARLMAVVGLDLSARTFAGGDPIRDEAQRDLLERLIGQASERIQWRYEVPVPIPGDRRAWDAVGEVNGERFAVEAETVGRDLQALLRRVALKRRDDPSISAVVVLFADTRANRSFVARNNAALAAELPVGARAVLDAIRSGHPPEGDGIVLV